LTLLRKCIFEEVQDLAESQFDYKKVSNSITAIEYNTSL